MRLSIINYSFNMNRSIVFKALLYSLIIIVPLTCSVQHTSAEEDSKNNNETMPRTQRWDYSGEQARDGKQVFKIKLKFRQGIYSSVQYGFNLLNESLYEEKNTLWKVIDSTVFMFLQEDKSLYIKGKIIEGDRLDVSWVNSLGSIWDSNHEDNEWQSSMTLELTNIYDDVLGREALWYPWIIPGYGETYGYTVP